MTQEQINAVLERVQAWPKSRQEDAARILLEMEDQGTGPYVLSDEEDADLEAALKEITGEDLVRANAQAQRGGYASLKDYVIELIRGDQDQHDWLVEALIEGENSGVSSRSVEDIIADAKAKIRNGEL